MNYFTDYDYPIDTSNVEEMDTVITSYNDLEELFGEPTGLNDFAGYPLAWIIQWEDDESVTVVCSTDTVNRNYNDHNWIIYGNGINSVKNLLTVLHGTDIND